MGETFRPAPFIVRKEGGGEVIPSNFSAERARPDMNFVSWQFELRKRNGRAER
jgi:hypothetical protein